MHTCLAQSKDTSVLAVSSQGIQPGLATRVGVTLIKHRLLMIYGKIQYSGWGLVQIQYLASPRAVFASRPHPSYCILRTSLAMVLQHKHIYTV